MFTLRNLLPLLLLLVPVTGLLPAPTASAEGAPAVTWARAFGGLGFSQPTAITTDSVGNIYLAGIFAGTVDFDPGPTAFTLTAQGSEDAFVAKLDANGNFLWARAFFGQGSAEPIAIAVDASGNVHTVGLFTGQVDFDPDTTVFSLTAPGGQGGFVSKLDTDGNFVWANAFGSFSSNEDGASGVAVDRDGNVYTTGLFSGTTDFDTGPIGFPVTAQGEADAFVRKQDADGNFLWVRAFSGPGENSGFALALDDDANVYATGIFQGTAEFGTTPGGFPLTANATPFDEEYDIFIAKLDTDGNLAWARAIGGPDADVAALAIAVDTQRNVYLTGEFFGAVDFDPGPASFELTAPFLENVFVTRLDANGEFVWARSTGNFASQTGFDLVLGPTEGVYVTGWFQGTVDFDPGPGVSEVDPGDAGLGAFVWKLNRDGSFGWARANAGPGVSTGNAIALDPSGALITTGFFVETVNFAATGPPVELTAAANTIASYILKLEPDGAVPVVLEGTITNALTEVPLPCAAVELLAGDGTRYTAVTDAAGAYFFEPLPPGDYTVRAVAPGFEAITAGAIVLGGEEPQTRDFALSPAPNRPAVFGQATDADSGAPLVGVLVELIVGGDPIADTITCADGRYEIPLLGLIKQDGLEAEIRFSLDNYELETIPTTVAPSGAEVNAALTKNVIGLAAVVGSVQRAVGTGPVVDARITLRGPVNTTISASADGTFALDALIDGSYTLTASAPGFEGQSLRRTLVAGAPTEVSFRLASADPLPTVPGDINGDGVVNAVDVQLVINAALGIPLAPGFNADINADGAVNAIDVQLVINAALGIPIG